MEAGQGDAVIVDLAPVLELGHRLADLEARCDALFGSEVDRGLEEEEEEDEDDDEDDDKEDKK